MNYTIKDIFHDKNNFFNINTISFIIMLIILNLFDYFTTIRALVFNEGVESNPVIAFITDITPLIHKPFIFGLYKIGLFIVYIYLLKISYDMIPIIFEDYNSKKYMFVFLYGIFIISMMISFYVIINNLMVLAL